MCAVNGAVMLVVLALRSGAEKHGSVNLCRGTIFAPVRTRLLSTELGFVSGGERENTLPARRAKSTPYSSVINPAYAQFVSERDPWDSLLFHADFLLLYRELVHAAPLYVY